MTAAEKKDFIAAIAILRAKRDRYKAAGQVIQASVVESCIQTLKAGK